LSGRIYKRGSTYWVAFYYKAKEYRRSAKTERKREAEKLLSFFMGQVARGEFKGFDRESGLTLFEILDDFIADYEQRGMRDVTITTYRAKNLRTFFKDIPAEDIDERKIDRYVKHRLNMGRTRTTVNRELQLLGQAMRLAHRKKLIASVPHIEKFSEQGNARQGFFEPNELEAIVSFLPDYLKDLARFAFHTGWRKSEILTLEWRDVQGDVIRLRPEIAKNKDGRASIVGSATLRFSRWIQRRGRQLH
jgi:integrase